MLNQSLYSFDSISFCSNIDGSNGSAAVADQVRRLSSSILGSIKAASEQSNRLGNISFKNVNDMSWNESSISIKSPSNVLLNDSDGS